MNDSVNSIYCDSAERSSPSFFFILSIPVFAALANLDLGDVSGFSYTGWVWVFLLAVGVLVIQTEMTFHNRIVFPYGPWLLWFGLVWLSLAWCEPLGRRNVQDALQITTPLLMAVAGSMCVRTEGQLRLLLLVTCSMVPFLGLIFFMSSGSAPSADPSNEQNFRTLAITTSFVGCVFLGGLFRKKAVTLAGYLACIALVALTGSRTATAALLVLPIVHPLWRGVLWRGMAVGASLVLATTLFYTSVFQDRFFHGGSGTLDQLLRGDFAGLGRFEAWPLIWEQAWKNPVFGAGVGSTNAFVPMVWPGVHHPHNDYLRVGFELGLIGLAIWLGVLLWQAWDLKKQIRQSSGVVRCAFAVSFLSLFLFLIMSCTDNPIVYNLWFTNAWFAVMGAAYGVSRRNRDSLDPIEDTETTSEPTNWWPGKRPGLELKRGPAP